jgi:hypothetical protein
VDETELELLGEDDVEIEEDDEVVVVIDDFVAKRTYAEDTINTITITTATTATVRLIPLSNFMGA